MPKAALGGHSIHYQQIGRGPDVVLIHGLFCNIAFWWFTVAAPLSEHCRVTALDLRGHGLSALPTRGYRAVDLAEDVTALMAHLGLGSAHLVGHSFGGAVALAVAVRHPELVSRLTLADAWVPSLQRSAAFAGRRRWAPRRWRARDPDGHAAVPRVAQGLLAEMEREGQNETAAGFVRSVLPDGGRGGRQPRSLRRWRELMDRTAAYREFHDPAGLGEAELRRVWRPARLVYGQRSQYRRTGEALGRLLPRSTSTTVEGAGHFFPLFRPRALVDVVTDAADMQGGAHAAE